MATKNANNNVSVKALKAHMAKEKKTSAKIKLEWEMACNTNNERGHVWSQSEIAGLYPRNYGGHCGATKRTHTYCHEGWEFNHIVVKRYKKNGHVFYGEGTGNQLIDEIACWDNFSETDKADFLCPILKAFTAKSDKVEATSEKMQERVMIIAQKAKFVSDLRGACEAAEDYNKRDGLFGEDKYTRKQQLLDFAHEMHWRDVEWNGGNSGVIFDYAKNCWKAVFIDYAL